MIGLTSNQLAVLNNDISSLDRTDVAIFQHPTNQQTYLHLIAAKRTYNLLRRNGDPQDVATAKSLIQLGPAAVHLRDHHDHTPLHTALVHGAVDIAAALLHATTVMTTLDPPVLVLLSTHGMLRPPPPHPEVENHPHARHLPTTMIEHVATILHHNPALVDQCLRSTIAGLGTLHSPASIDPWIDTLHHLLQYPTLPTALPTTDTPAHFCHSSRRTLLEFAYGHLLRSQMNPQDVSQRTDTFSKVVALLQKHGCDTTTTTFTGGISFDVACDMCHQRVNMGPTQTWLEGHSLLSHAARCGEMQVVKILCDTKIGGSPTGAPPPSLQTSLQPSLQPSSLSASSSDQEEPGTNRAVVLPARMMGSANQEENDAKFNERHIDKRTLFVDPLMLLCGTGHRTHIHTLMYVRGMLRVLVRQRFTTRPG